MKFVIVWTNRSGGSAAENVAANEAAQKLLSTPPTWVQRCDGNGGFAVVETDNSGELYKDLATWIPCLEIQLHPVLDIQEAAAIGLEALSIAKSAF